MKSSFFAVAVCLMAWPSTGNAAFKTCEDAWNYGSNTGNIFAGTFYNTLACDVAEREESESVLARNISKFVARGADTDAHLLCLYSGLYSGLLQRASVEYAKCYTSTFSCLPRATVGQYAVAVLAALYDSVARPRWLTPRDVRENLDLGDVVLAGDPLCRSCDGCEEAIREFLKGQDPDDPDDDYAVREDLVAQLIELTCVCAEAQE
jgi:hypothetical protein